MNRQPSAPATIPFVAEQSAFEQLVIEQLGQLQRGHAEIKAEIVAVGTVSQRTLEQATRTNGHVAEHEAAIRRLFERLESLEDREHDADVAENARRAQRQEDREKVRTALDTVKDAWPLAAALVLSVATVWAMVLGLFG